MKALGERFRFYAERSVHDDVDRYEAEGSLADISDTIADWVGAEDFPVDVSDLEKHLVAQRPLTAEEVAALVPLINAALEARRVRGLREDHEFKLTPLRRRLVAMRAALHSLEDDLTTRGLEISVIEQEIAAKNRAFEAELRAEGAKTEKAVAPPAPEE